MIKIVLPVVFAALLAGCATGDNDLTGRTMILHSEECRLHASQIQASNDMAAGRPVDDKDRDFDRDYYACMFDKGYKLGGDRLQ